MIIWQFQRYCISFLNMQTKRVDGNREDRNVTFRLLKNVLDSMVLEKTVNTKIVSIEEITG